jgi:hypothetical protein
MMVILMPEALQPVIARLVDLASGRLAEMDRIPAAAVCIPAEVQLRTIKTDQIPMEGRTRALGVGMLAKFLESMGEVRSVHNLAVKIWAIRRLLTRQQERRSVSAT